MHREQQEQQRQLTTSTIQEIKTTTQLMMHWAGYNYHTMWYTDMRNRKRMQNAPLSRGI
jgi:hypothetical protein